MAVLNDFRKDFKQILLDEDLRAKEVAVITGKKEPFISQFTTRREIVNSVFTEIYDKLGYDIRVEYIKREG